MIIPERTAALDGEPALVRPRPETRRSPRRKPQSRAASATALKVRQVLDAVGRSIPLETVELPDEFFPAHLSVALVDLVFRFGLGGGEQPPPMAERYCRQFGLAQVRTDWALPRTREQERLGTLVRRYDEFGLDRMANEVFRSRCCFPGTTVPRVAYVVRIANELGRIGIYLLQDVQVRRIRDIDEALRPLPGVDEHFVRMLLTYTGDDDRVVGGDHVRSFVARAIDSTVSAAEAVDLVRQAAHELILSPRYLDYQIWRCDLERSLALQTEDGLAV